MASSPRVNAFVIRKAGGGDRSARVFQGTGIRCRIRAGCRLLAKGGGTMRQRLLRLLFLVALLGGATGCAATVTALKYKDLEVQTKMSETIFLEPVSPAERTVWIEVKNTSDQDVDLSPLAGMLQAKGWKVVQDPDAAHYRLQVNVLYVGKASQAAIDNAVYAGFGGPLFGAASETCRGRRPNPLAKEQRGGGAEEPGRVHPYPLTPLLLCSQGGAHGRE